MSNFFFPQCCRRWETCHAAHSFEWTAARRSDLVQPDAWLKAFQNHREWNQGRDQADFKKLRKSQYSVGRAYRRKFMSDWKQKEPWQLGSLQKQCRGHEGLQQIARPVPLHSCSGHLVKSCVPYQFRAALFAERPNHIRQKERWWDFHPPLRKENLVFWANSRLRQQS